MTLVLLDWSEDKVQLVLKAHKVPRVKLVNKAVLVLKVHPVQLEKRALLALEANQDLLDEMA